MADERNFRSHFYEKMGFRGVEENKVIENLLKEQPYELKKLSQFCLKFPVPAIYRLLVWKVLLGILPPYQESHEFVMTMRTDQFNDLMHSLKVMGKVDDRTPLPLVFLKMYHMEEGTLLFDENRLVMQPEGQSFMAVAAAVLEMVESHIDAYWISTKFYKLQEKWKDIMHVLSERTEHYLKKEDPDGKLYTKVLNLNIFGAIPLSRWFSSSFAGVLPETSFERIWDKIIGGSCTVLVFVAVAIILTLRRPILTLRTDAEIVQYLKNIPADSADIIVAKAVELWRSHGSLLFPSGIKADSPVIIEKVPS
ncbi:TBC1 domain family member 7-like [Lingula anatina]|uniref:TBC1 domain family member 7 n=1 Tax=Lingula anatina TaxID=7574 RepID=A0A1S3HDP5_LINAN|nr:TBC1 domain family member 7-like [Lingula anatina]|eukprot:XP_013384172.1 TBC1 domain family member 7-like [Lingula anatina]